MFVENHITLYIMHVKGVSLPKLLKHFIVQNTKKEAKHINYSGCHSHTQSRKGWLDNQQHVETIAVNNDL